MQFFTIEEFKAEYEEYASLTIPNWHIKATCEMIFSQIGLIYRDASWTSTSVPSSIKRASMEQLRFMIEHDLPFVDLNGEIEAGPMKAKLKSDYSTLTLRILANNGYAYRGNPMNQNMGINIPFGSD